MSNDYTDLAIEHGLTRNGCTDDYLITRDQLNATIEAAIQKAFDDAEVVAYCEPSELTDMKTKKQSGIMWHKQYSGNEIPLIAKRVEK
jgi:hypothetical protein